MALHKPDIWTTHHPRKCGADEMPEGYPCNCPPGWPRKAAWWRGECAVGVKKVENLLKRWREASAAARS